MLQIRPFLVLCFAFPLALASARAVDAPSTPLLPNSGFETDTDGDRWPDQWAKAKIGGTWEDENGKWHTETASGSDRPETDVQDS